MIETHRIHASRQLRPAFTLEVSFVAFGLLSACRNLSGSGQDAESTYPEQTSVHIGATLGPDDTLWRLTAGRSHVYVDRSTDRGRTFSPPVAVNMEPQRIKVDSENRPDIVVDRRGHVCVSYTAEAQRPTTLYISASADGGRHFAKPRPASDQATQANSFQGRLRLSPDDRVYLFWHDERHRVGEGDTGNALYFTILGSESGMALPPRKAADTQCKCCRPAVDFDTDGRPVAFA